MDQEIAVNKVLRDLKQFQLIKPDDEGLVRLHLTRLAVACWEEGDRASFYKIKAVSQYTKYGVFISNHIGVKEASLKTGDKEKTIYEAIRNNRTTKSGNIWKYKDDTIEKDSRKSLKEKSE
jgi:hypothetical protein